MSLNIYITNIKVNNISNIGSLNIGKTIICRNQTSQTELSSPGSEPEIPPAQVESAVMEQQVKPDVSPGQVGTTDSSHGNLGAPGASVLPRKT